jgi:phospholipase/lecithinase/hemolysin
VRPSAPAAGSPLLLPDICHAVGVKPLVRWTVILLLFASAVFSATAAGFSSLYAFGDGACTTTNNTSGLSYYYGNSFCNGRIWIQVLAQRQGLPYITNQNISYFGQYGANLVSAVTSFTAPTNASNALFLIWICDADSVYDMEQIYPSTNITAWNNAMNLSLTNQLNAVQILYNKGVRTLIMPNAVDITEIPKYDATAPADRSFIRAQITNFNANFIAALSNMAATNHGLKIYVPDIFSLLDNVLTNAAGYGLTNVLSGGLSIDAVSDPNLSDISLNGPGANYIFWDPFDPGAKFHEVIADYVQQFISPARISQITPLPGSNQLNVINFPAGLNGFVDGRTNIMSTNWQSLRSFTNASTTQTLFVTNSGPQYFYRLRFPYAWYYP